MEHEPCPEDMEPEPEEEDEEEGIPPTRVEAEEAQLDATWEGSVRPLARAKEFAEAQRLAQQCAAGYAQLLGIGNAKTQNAARVLGRIGKDMAKQEARRRKQAAEAARQAVLAAMTPQQRQRYEQLDAAWNEAMAHCRVSEFAQAQGLAQGCADGYAQLLGAEHATARERRRVAEKIAADLARQTAESSRREAQQRHQQEQQAAEHRRQEALAAMTPEQRQHNEQLDASAAAAMAHCRCGEFAQAKVVAQQCADGFTELLGPEHEKTQHALKLQGVIEGWMAQQKAEGARQAAAAAKDEAEWVKLEQMTPSERRVERERHEDKRCLEPATLVAAAASSGATSCDACGGLIAVGAIAHSCRVCDYDLCSSCGGGEPAEPEPELLSSATAAATAATSNFESLAARVGPGGEGQGGGGAAAAWQVQIPLLVRADWLRQGRLPPSLAEDSDSSEQQARTSEQEAAYAACLQENPWARSFDSWCSENPHHRAQIKQKAAIDGGWNEADAAVLNICSDYLSVLTDAVRNSCTDFADLLHHHQRIVCQRARLQGGTPAAVGYKHLEGKKGLVHRDPQWTAMTTCPGRIVDTPMVSNGSTYIWSGSSPVLVGPDGLRVRDYKSGGLVTVSSPVVRFVSRPCAAMATGASALLHTAVDTGGGGLMYPPLTKFSVVERREPGCWQHDATAAVVEACRRLFDGEAPTPVMEEQEGGQEGSDGGGSDSSRRRRRLSISRNALWRWLEGDGRTVPGGGGGSRDPFDRHDGAQQEWVARTLFPDGTESSFFAVNQQLIVVHAAFLDTETCSAA